jgi:hypothetical protein
VIPEEDCSEAGESESAIPKCRGELGEWRIDLAATVAHTTAVAYGGGRGA